jgi:hypothetical protein
MLLATEVTSSLHPVKTGNLQQLFTVCFIALLQLLQSPMNMSAAHVYEVDDITSLFYLPLSRAAYDELSELQILMQLNPLLRIKKMSGLIVEVILTRWQLFISISILTLLCLRFISCGNHAVCKKLKSLVGCFFGIA